MKKALVFLFLLPVAFQFWHWRSDIFLGERGYVTNIISQQRRFCDLYFWHSFCPWFYNKLSFYPNLLIKNYITALSLNYLFLERQNYVIELPLFLTGVYFLITNKNRFKKYILFYFLLYPFLGPIFSFDWPTNYWLIKPMLLILEFYGLINMLKVISVRKKQNESFKEKSSH